MIPKRNADLEMAAIRSSVFANAARDLQITVSSAELKQRSAAIKKMYPGHEIDSSKVETILLAEKYLEKKGFPLPGQDSVHAMEGKVDPTRFSSQIELEQAERMTLFQESMGRADVQREARNLEDIEQIKRNSGHEATEMRASRELQVHGDPEECLARNGNACLVTLREYNAATLLYAFPARMPLDSAKAAIMRRYLVEKRLADSARALGLDRNPDSVLRRQRLTSQGARWLQSAKRLGVPVKDNQSLKSAYGRYYERYFAPGEEVSLAIIGSSDSAYIDSLYRIFSAWERNGGPLRAPARKMAKEPDLPWSYFKAEELPEEMAALTDAFRPGQCSPPYRSGAGRFLVRLAAAVRKPEVPFSDAFPCLVFLATRDKYLNMDSVVEAQARRYYSANQARFAYPDTMALQAWLIPGQEKASLDPADRKGGKAALSDTSRFKAMAVSSLSLPDDIRIALQDAVRKDSLRSFFGPLENPYGRWYFKIRSKKPAHGFLPYRLARKGILERLLAPMEERDMGMASVESQNEALLNLGLAQAYRQAEMRKRMEERALEKGDMPEKGPETNGSPDMERRAAGESAKRRLQEEQARNRDETSRIIEEAGVDFDRLFK